MRHHAVMIGPPGSGKRKTLSTAGPVDDDGHQTQPIVRGRCTSRTQIG